MPAPAVLNNKILAVGEPQRGDVVCSAIADPAINYIKRLWAARDKYGSRMIS